MDLKYRIPKLKFNASPSQSMEYELYLKKSTDPSYQLISNDYLVDKEGRNLNKVVFSAEDDTKYDIRLVNKEDSDLVFEYSFTSNKNLNMGENPYVGKKLFLGQTKDIFVNGLFTESLPNISDGGLFFTYDNNYREAQSNVGNMVPVGGTSFKTAVDSQNSERALVGLYFGGDNYVKFNDVANNIEDRFTDTYIFNSTGDKSFSFVFSVLFENLTDKVIISTGDSNNKFSIELISNKITVSITKEGVTQTATSVNNVETGKLYNIRVSINPQEPSANRMFVLYPGGNILIDGTINQVPTPNNNSVYIGADAITEDPSEGMIVSYLYFYPESSFPNIDEWKVTTPQDYKPKIKLQLESSGTEPEIKVGADHWLKFSDTLLSYKVPLDIAPGEYTTWVERFNGNKVNVENNIEVIEPEQDLVGFDIDLTSGVFEDKVDELKEHFFAFHGQWGGANGGVSSELLYLSPSGKSLVMEMHGEEYKGDLQGVDRVATDSSFTGYGEPKYHDNNLDPNYPDPWITRVGACIVSQNYLGYGEYNISMKVPKGTYGYAPAIWLFHYQELYPGDPSWDYWISRGNKPYEGEDPYMVINHEIDIELPSHLYHAIFSSWGELESTYFDPNALDDQYHVVINDPSNEQPNGLYLLSDVENPNEKESWTFVSSTYEKLDVPSFSNVKFNNWIGEKLNGSGYAATQGDYEDTEEYLALLTKLEKDYADDEFHKWTIKWYKDRTELWVDDIYIRSNRAFVPSIAGRLTIGGWFPSANNPTGSEPWKYNTDRAWAGHPANFDILHMEINKVSFIPYDAQEAGGSNDVYAETFPETNLREIE